MKHSIGIFLILLVLISSMAFGEVYDATTHRNVGGRGLTELIDNLQELPDDTTVNMKGVRMKIADRASLKRMFPSLNFEWDVNFADVTVPGDIQTLDLDTVVKKKLGYDTLRNTIVCLPQLTRVVMYHQRLSSDRMLALMEEFPQITFEWSIPVGKYAVRTDSTAFSTLKGRQKPRYTAKDMTDLKYCPGLLALDFGHQNISDLSFFNQWPNLRILIVVDSMNPITDLTPLNDMKELEYVELFMQEISDLTPLANHTRLLDLNLCHNNVTDLTPLYSCTSLERLWISYNPNLSMEQIEAFKKALPNCKVEYSVYSSTGAGWREHERYFIMKDIFETRRYRPFESDNE